MRQLSSGKSGEPKEVDWALVWNWNHFLYHPRPLILPHLFSRWLGPEDRVFGHSRNRSCDTDTGVEKVVDVVLFAEDH